MVSRPMIQKGLNIIGAHQGEARFTSRHITDGYRNRLGRKQSLIADLLPILARPHLLGPVGLRGLACTSQRQCIRRHVLGDRRAGRDIAPVGDRQRRHSVASLPTKTFAPILVRLLILPS